MPRLNSPGSIGMRVGVYGHSGLLCTERLTAAAMRGLSDPADGEFILRKCCETTP
jgi:hypothetical protein